MVPPMSDPSVEFEPHRRRLTGLAHRLLGSRAEADDVVQNAIAFEIDADLITRIYVVRYPNKLPHLQGRVN